MTHDLIAPSILAANVAHLGDEVRAVLDAGADWVHVDVMDNHYVPNITYGPVVVRALRYDGITAPLDVHLMVKPVDRLIAEFAEAGASTITFHPEASEHIDRSLQLIHEHDCQAGLAFNPATSLDLLTHVVDKVDLILLMSVNPGFGGQTLIPSVFKKLVTARQIIDDGVHPIRLEVDGGVNSDNIGKLATAGADTFVAGSAIFGSEDYAASIAEMRDKLAEIRA